MILKRSTVEFFIKNDFTHIFGNSFNVPDEHYFINIINKFDIQYFDMQITHTDWSVKDESQKYNPHPKTYYILSIDTVNKIIESGYFFMRKISSECIIPEELILKISC